MKTEIEEPQTESPQEQPAPETEDKEAKQASENNVKVLGLLLFL